MKKQFEEIGSQLDKITGGQSLFEIDTQADLNDFCGQKCSDDCSPTSIGTYKGTVTGTKLPGILNPKL